jgi:hypothetical protein
VRELRAREAEEQGDYRRAEIERLIATHLHARGPLVARGYRRRFSKRPRGLHHALSARHPITRRRLLYVAALALLELLEDDAGPPAKDTGARRVFGKTQAWYAKVLGYSQKRGRNGEVHGARHIRTCLTQLAALGFIRKGGRAWFEAPPGVPRDAHKRLVVWLQPWDDTLIARLADALGVEISSSANAEIPSSANDADRIPGSGCFTPTPSDQTIVGGGEGSVRGEEEGASRRLLDGGVLPPSTPAVDNQPATPATPTENTEGPSAPANEGERASAMPTVAAPLDASAATELLGVGVLRVFRGPPLAAVVKHLASTHQRPVDAWDGRAATVQPSLKNAAPMASQRPAFGGRPHPAPCGCDSCQAWARAVIAAPPALPPSVSPAWTGRMATPLLERFPSGSGDHADTMQLPSAPGHHSACRCVSCFESKSEALAVVDERRRGGSRWPLLELELDESPVLGLFRPTAMATLEEALGRRVVWQRRHDDPDYPLCAVVDGERWRLRFNGPGTPATTPIARWRPMVLVVDGRELGLVEHWPGCWSR